MEADEPTGLGRGLQGLAIRVAKAVKMWVKHRGAADESDASSRWLARTLPAQYCGVRSNRWYASMNRTVRVCERITTELVIAPPFT